MPKILIATANRGKLHEIHALLADLPLTLLIPADLGLVLEVAETGDTYAVKAAVKATAFARLSGLLTLADDSGVGVKTEMSYGGAMLTLAFTTDTSGADLQNPWSSYPGYTSVQVKDFNRAKEKAFLVKAAYDFTHLGLEGVTAYALVVHGWDRINPTTGQDVANENELDLDLQWNPKSGFFKNFWPRVPYGVVHQYEGEKNYIHDFRIILNYALPVL